MGACGAAAQAVRKFSHLVCREMKKGNIGLALGMVGKKLKSSLGASVDLGLTGKDGVVHPSLTVNTHTAPCRLWTLWLLVPLFLKARWTLFSPPGQRQEAGAERGPVRLHRGELAVQIREGKDPSTLQGCSPAGWSWSEAAVEGSGPGRRLGRLGAF